MYVIKNAVTQKYVYGTDYRYSPYRQRTSKEKALLFEYEEEANMELKHRQCGKDYIIAKVELKEV